MEAVFLFCMIIWTNPIYLGILVYMLGFLTQMLISTHFIRKRKSILMETYNYNEKRLIRLWILSSIFFPVAWYYGVKSLILKTKTKKPVITQDEGDFGDEDVDGVEE